MHSGLKNDTRSIWKKREQELIVYVSLRLWSIHEHSFMNFFQSTTRKMMKKWRENVRKMSWWRQLLDLPGIIEGAKDGKGRGRQVIAVGRTCNLILIVLDALKPLHHKRIICQFFDISYFCAEIQNLSKFKKSINRENSLRNFREFSPRLLSSFWHKRYRKLTYPFFSEYDSLMRWDHLWSTMRRNHERMMDRSVLAERDRSF